MERLERLGSVRRVARTKDETDQASVRREDHSEKIWTTTAEEIERLNSQRNIK